MLSSTKQLMSCFKDPIREIKTIREGINPELIENFLSDQSFVVKDILISLNIKPSTYFAKKKDHKRLDPTSTEKFLRLFSVVQIAQEILGHAEAWSGLSADGSIGIGLVFAGHRLIHKNTGCHLLAVLT